MTRRSSTRLQWPFTASSNAIREPSGDQSRPSWSEHGLTQRVSCVETPVPTSRRRCRPRPRCSRRWWPSRKRRSGSRPGTSQHFERPSSRRFPGTPRATGAALPTGPSHRGDHCWRPPLGGGRRRRRRCPPARPARIRTDRVHLRPLGNHHSADDRRADHDRQDSCPTQAAVALRRRRERSPRRCVSTAHARQGRPTVHHFTQLVLEVRHRSSPPCCERIACIPRATNDFTVRTEQPSTSAACASVRSS